MAAGWSVMDAINRNSKAAAEDRPKARFRTRDISVKKMYSNDMNFYSRQDIEELSNLILAVGLIENMSYAVCPHCGDKWELFGSSHRAEIESAFGVKTLARVPVDSALAELGDAGKLEDYENHELMDALAAAAESVVPRP